MDIYNALVKDSGGACSQRKIMYVYNNCVKDKDVNTIVEIGVYNGCFLLPITKLTGLSTHGIDPFKEYLQTDIDDKVIYDKAANVTCNQSFLDGVYDRLISNINQFGLDVTIHRDLSENVADQFESIDILHIDGNHDYGFVLRDLNLYSSKITQNGYIIADDTDWTCVRRAVNDFLSSNDFEIVDDFGDWCVLKRC